MWKSDSRSRVLCFVTGASLLIGAAVLGVSSRAQAFNNPFDYGKFPEHGDLTLLGGGAGRYFTGSPADAYSCENCHSSKSNPDYHFPLVQTGLPVDGYIPGQPYKIELSSPVAMAQLAQAAASGNDPASGMTAEFVAQDGGPAGTISFVSGSDSDYMKFPGQYCDSVAKVPPMSDFVTVAKEYGMNIYAVDTGSRSDEITLAKTGTDPDHYDGTCTVDHGTTDDGVPYERRCVVAAKTCGQKSIKFLWTAPEKWSGPIWFSMGFVATYNRTNEPDDEDYVTTMTIPLNPGYAGPTHENTLDSGCSVAGGAALGARSSHLPSGVFAAALWLSGGLLLRRRQRRKKGSSSLPLSAALMVAFACFGIGCTDNKGLIVDVPSPVGAYETANCERDCEAPIVCRMCAWPDSGTPEGAAEALKNKPASGAGTMTTGASSPFGALDPSAGSPSATGLGALGGAAGAGMTSTPADAPPSLGSVTAVFTTAQPADEVSVYVSKCSMQPCWPHYLAAWIEDDKGLYVKSLFDQKGMYIALSLGNYYGLGSDCQVEKETIDAMSMATYFAHEQHTLTWNGLYGSGHKAAPPGLYHLKIEVAISEQQHIPVADVPFMFGDPAPTTNMIDPAPAHTGVVLTYTPNPPPPNP